jgi:hypothetical protein
MSALRRCLLALPLMVVPAVACQSAAGAPAAPAAKQAADPAPVAKDPPPAPPVVAKAEPKSEPKAADPPPAAPQQAAPAQASPPAQPQQPAAGEPAPAAQQAPDQPKLPQGLVPAQSVDKPGVSIPDIAVHRNKPLSYVRRMSDHVELNLPKLNPDAQVVLEVDGRPISRGEFRRRALMLTAVNQTDKYVTKLLTDTEVDRSKAANEGRDFAISDTDIDARFAETEKLVRLSGRNQNPMTATPESSAPSADPNDPGEKAVAAWKDSINSSIGMEEYRNLLAGDARFEKAYLPFPKEKVAGTAWDFNNGPPPLDEPRPDWMPQASWDAMGKGEQGRNLRSFLKQWAINGEEIPAMFKPSILKMIRDGLIDTVGVSFFFDEPMPEDVFMRVGDKPVTTDELWPLVAGELADTDIEMVARELLTLEGMKKALAAVTYSAQVADPAGPPRPDGTPAPATTHAETRQGWMNDGDFKKAWNDYEAQYTGSFIPLSTIIQLRGYTSTDRFREHFRYRESFNRWKKAGLTDDQVLEHYQGGGRLFFERGSVVVDIAYCPLGKRPFTDEGLADTRKELADAVAQAKATGGDDWFSIVTAKYPAPESRQPGDGHSFQRNQLSMQTAESELSKFLTGYSKTDESFYLANKGDIVGPWTEICRHHAWGGEENAGAWAIHVKDYTRSRQLAVFSGRDKDLAYEDWCDLNYFYWSQECLKALVPKVKVPKS